MLENRDYMRQGPSHDGFGQSRWSPSVVLMIVLTVAYAIQCINDVYIKSTAEEWLALTPLALAKGYVWQLLTFQFLHVNLWHLAGNVITLWFFGRFVEEVLGTRRFLVAYFGAGIIGGLLQCALMLLFPEHFPPLAYGASAGIAGIFAIFCRLQ
ncbi:MAG TPA: rhomboid family intramembrane serine protease, partial [Pyrinomonadaceae bacterium]|nr:rhomboid family intramembrane serine protease [Pyrinomonadaceae bacterium]